MKNKVISELIRKISLFMALIVALLGIGITGTACERNDELVTVYPEKISGKLNNPGMGWATNEDCLFLGNQDLGASGSLPDVDVIYMGTSWAICEPEEGVYDFSLIDNTIEYWRQYDKRFQIKISTDSYMHPSTYYGAPRWLIDKYDIPYMELDYTNGGPVQKLTAVDVSNKQYLEHLDKFLAAINDHYGSYEDVDTFEIRGFGNWGEWHDGYLYENLDMQRGALEGVIDHYVDAFKENGKLLVLSTSWDPQYLDSYGSGDEGYRNYYRIGAYDYAFSDDNIAFRRDGIAATLLYNYDERFMQEAFNSGKRLPQFAEFANGLDNLLNEESGFDLISGLDDGLYKLRANYCTVPGWENDSTNRVIQLGKREVLDHGNEVMGYRLSVDKARYPKYAVKNSEIDVFTQWSNTATGRFWYEDKLAIYLLNEQNEIVSQTINEDFDATNYVFGEINNVYSKLKIGNVSDGTYSIAVGIVDEEGTPHIELGMGGKVEDTCIYKLGEIILGNKAGTDTTATKMTWDEFRNYKFAPNTGYQVTLRYTPAMALEDFVFGTRNGYVFRLTTEKGGESAAAGYTKWQDVSERRSDKTFTFVTGNYSDYKAELISEGFGEIRGETVWVEKTDISFFDDFENYAEKQNDLINFEKNFLTSGALEGSILLRSDTEDSGAVNVISGDKSAMIECAENGDKYGIYLNYDKKSLKPNTSYTVTFNFRVKDLTDVGPGGYYILSGYNSEDATYKTIGTWYYRADTFDHNITYTFNTGDDFDSLAIGAHNKGAFIIDNVLLIENAAGETVVGEDIPIVPNDPREVSAGIGITADFEDGTLTNSAFTRGINSQAKLTNNPDYVINGKYSLFAHYERANYQDYYFSAGFTNSKYFTFEPGATYIVEFKYKVIGSVPADSVLYIFFTDERTGYDETTKTTYVGQNRSDSAGKAEQWDVTDDDGNYLYSMYRWTVTLAEESLSHPEIDALNYQFYFGVYGYMTVSIDDVLILKAG